MSRPELHVGIVDLAGVEPVLRPYLNTWLPGGGLPHRTADLIILCWTAMEMKLDPSTGGGQVGAGTGRAYAYTHAMQRDDMRYKDAADWFRKKPPESESESKRSARSRRA